MELADILIYLVRLADLLETELYDAADQEISINEYRFPEVSS